MYVVIIDPTDGSVEYTKVFDTYKSSSRFDKFTKRKLPKGYIVVAACKDECSTKLSEKIFTWFERMGSK